MNADRMLTPEEACDTVLAHIAPLGIERVSLLDATGRVLARDVLARRDNPPHDNSAMDGFALRFEFFNEKIFSCGALPFSTSTY